MIFWFNKIKTIGSRYGIYVVFLLTIVLRIIKLKYAFYGHVGEMFRDLNVVYDLVNSRHWVFVGPSSALGGFSFGPVYYYILTPFVLLSNFLPWGAVLSSAFFSTLSAIVFYQLLNLWFRLRGLAALGALLMAISLYDIQNAYWISNPALLPFFVLLFLYCLTLILQHKAKWWAWIGLGLCLGVATQLHATALLLLPLVLLLMVGLGKLKITFRGFALTVIPFIITYFPYLYYEVISHFQNLKGLLALSQSSFSWKVGALTVADIAGFWDRAIFFKSNLFNLFFVNSWLFVGLTILYFSAVITVFVSWKQNGQTLTKPVKINQEGKILVLCWLCASSAMFVLFQHSIQQFYFLVLWPLPLVLLSWLLWWLKENRKKTFLFALAAYFILQLCPLPYFYKSVEQKQYDYKQFQALFSQITQDQTGDSFKIVNGSFDVNMFAYYLKLSGMDKREARAKASYIYVILENNSGKFPEAMPAGYQKTGEFKESHILAVKYQKLN